MVVCVGVGCCVLLPSSAGGEKLLVSVGAGALLMASAGVEELIVSTSVVAGSLRVAVRVANAARPSFWQQIGVVLLSLQ